MTMGLDFCCLNEKENEDTCIFSQALLFTINNLFQISLHNFRKVFFNCSFWKINFWLKSSDVENIYENYQELCCECVNKSWYLIYKIGQLFEKDEQKNHQVRKI